MLTISYRRLGSGIAVVTRIISSHVNQGRVAWSTLELSSYDSTTSNFRTSALLHALHRAGRGPGPDRRFEKTNRYFPPLPAFHLRGEIAAPLRARQVEHQGSDRASHRFGTDFRVSGPEICPQRCQAFNRLRSGPLRRGGGLRFALVAGFDRRMRGRAALHYPVL